MKIGIFTDSYRPYTSGVVQSIELFTREYLKKGHKVYVFGPDQPIFKNRIKSEEGVFRFLSIPAPNLTDFNIPIPISPQMRATMKKIGLDIIHVHTPFVMGRLGARAARRFGIPVIFTYHTLYDQYAHYFPFAEKASRKVIQNISRDFCNKCNMVITPSTPVKNYLDELGVVTPIRVIPTGIDLDEFSNNDENWLHNKYSISKDEKILLFVGRLGKEKNLPFLIKAFKQILQVRPKTRLVIIGGGPLEESLKQFCVKLNIENKVIFTGLLSRYKIVHCYASADIFTFPSVTETQGLVIGEAKAGGLPVVAVDAFGASDMVIHGEDGFLTDLSINNFKRRILQLLQSEELYKDMSAKALQNAEYLSSAYCAEKMLQSYHDVLSGTK